MKHSRWAKTATTWSPTTRLVVTVPVVGVWLYLALATLRHAAALDPAAALGLFATGIYTIYALPLIRYMWNANDSWKFSKAQQAARSQDIRTLASRQPTAEPGDAQ
jgi:hypothetical protein